MENSERTALVTGASRGIGKAIALALAQDHIDVLVAGRDLQALTHVQSQIAHMGRRCHALEVDFAASGAAERIWDLVLDRFGPIDILVNNAGIGSSADPKPLVAFDDEFWELTLRVNLSVPYKLCKMALPAMVARGRGRLLFISSINAFRSGVHDAAYSASKAGMLGLMRTVAREHVKDGITSNAICPGTTATATADRRLRYDAERLGMSTEELQSRLVPIGRRVLPHEVAALARFLISTDAVTGQTFVIDGGQLACA